MKDEKQLEGLAYSYIRFSAKEQEKGDSLRRQTELRDAWLKRNPNVRLDTALTLQDLGVSAFRGLNSGGDKHALSQFLKAVEAGRVPKGSFLIIENLDRLSREEEEDAVALFLNLIRSGITIVQLEPETVFRRGDGMLGIIRAVIELSRAHAESARKSQRVGAAWANRKREAATKGAVLTRQCPAWLEVVDDKFRFRDGAQELIQRMFDRCIAGYGCRAIAKELNDERVKTWSKGKWEEAYVRLILAGRAVVGECQPMKGSKGPRVPDGDPIPNYFPAAVTEKIWNAAQAARKLRDRHGGRPAKHGEHVNVFQNLLWFANESGVTLNVNTRLDRGHRYRVLVPSSYKRHGGKCVAFPLNVFERALLTRLKEIDPREVLPHQTDAGTQLLEKKGELARVEASITAITADMEANGESPVLFKRLREKETRQQELVKELADVRQRAASPMSEAWSEAQSLLVALLDADDTRDARVRLQSALRRLIDSIWVLMSKRGNQRLASVQVVFAGGEKVRHFRIAYRPPLYNGKTKALTPGQYWAKLVRFYPASEAVDLSKPEDAERELKSLAGFDPSRPGAETDPLTMTGHIRLWKPTADQQPARPKQKRKK